MVNYLCNYFVSYSPSSLTATPRQSSTFIYQLFFKTFKLAVSRRSSLGRRLGDNMRVNFLRNCLLLAIIFIFNDVACQQSELQQKYSELSKAQPFALFDLNLSQEEINILESLTIHEPINDKPMVLNCYGNLDQFECKVSEFLQSFGNSLEDSKIAAKIIYKIAKNCCQSMGVDEAWIAIRAFKKNNLYDIARWHIDSERLYTPRPDHILYKIACALKGDSTLFCNVSNDMRSQYLAMRSKSYVDKKKSREQAASAIRMNIAEFLQDLDVEFANAGQAAIFIMGDEKTGAIHSEPVMDKDRIFMSIIPGNHQQIQELYHNWHQVIANRFK